MKLSLSAPIVLAFTFPFVAARLSSASTGPSFSSNNDDASVEGLALQKKSNNQGWNHIIGAAVTFDHIVSDKEHDSDSVNSKLLMGLLSEAFTEVYTGMSTNWGFVSGGVEIPEDAPPEVHGNDGIIMTHQEDKDETKKDAKEDVEWWIDYWFSYSSYASWEADCRWCPPDMLAGGPDFDDFMKDAKRWKRVSDLLCEKLQNTGLPQLANVDNCSINVGYVLDLSGTIVDANQAVDGPSPSLLPVYGSSNAQIVIQQHLESTLLGSLPDALAASYNTVMHMTPYTIERIEITRQITAPTHATDNEVVVTIQKNRITTIASSSQQIVDEATSRFFSLVWVKVYWKCEGGKCDGSDMIVILPSSTTHAAMKEMQGHFESYFCYNLRESSSVEAAAADGCQVRFERVTGP